jgi:hypothetical protein
MMPVELGMISSKTQPMASARATQERWQASMPGAPVAQLALPALTRTARTWLPVAARWERPTVMGAATSWLLVNMAAAGAGVSQTAMATSGVPEALRPAVAEDQRKPRGRLMSLIEIRVSSGEGTLGQVMFLFSDQRRAK